MSYVPQCLWSAHQRVAIILLFISVLSLSLSTVGSTSPAASEAMPVEAVYECRDSVGAGLCDSVSLLQPQRVSEMWPSRRQASLLSEKWQDASREEMLQEAHTSMQHSMAKAMRSSVMGATLAWKSAGHFDLGMEFPKHSPMPLIMWAALSLVIQYFVMHVLRTVATCYNYYFFNGAARLATALEAVSGAVVYTPMLCTLFLGPWFRGMRLTGSLDPSLFELPQAWLDLVTIVCSAGIILKTIIHFAAAYLLANVSADTKEKRAGLPLALQTICQGSHLLAFASVACVVVGTTVMQPRFDPGEEMRTMSTSTANTMLLASQYFVLHIIARFRNSGSESCDNNSDSSSNLRSALDLTKMVPMLCLTFQAAGMHALEQDPPAGQPPLLIRTGMNIASCALFSVITLQFICCFLTGRSGGDGGVVFSTVRSVLRLVVFIAAFCVCGSIWADPRLHNRKHSKELLDNDPFDPFDMTVFASDMVLSVVLVATLFLGAHLVSWLAELSGPTPRSKSISATALSALDICPIVAVLIVILRLRSLQISAGLGEPEARVEICMYLVFLGLLGRLLFGTIGAVATRSGDESAPENVPEDTNREESGCMCVSLLNGVVGPLQLASTLLVYVSILVMLVGCVSMAKENMQELQRPFGQFVNEAS